MSDLLQCDRCGRQQIHLPFTRRGYTGLQCGVCRVESNIRPIPGANPQPGAWRDLAPGMVMWDIERPAPPPRPQQAPRPPVEYGESGKPICHLTQRGMGEDERRGGWCINEAVYGTLGRAGRDKEAGEFAHRIASVRGVTNKEVYKEIFKIALDYVEVR